MVSGEMATGQLSRLLSWKIKPRSLHITTVNSSKIEYFITLYLFNQGNDDQVEFDNELMIFSVFSPAASVSIAWSAVAPCDSDSVLR